MLKTANAPFIYYAVPGDYGIGPKYPDVEEAHDAALAKIRPIYGTPNFTRAFVEIRVVDESGDQPVHRYEVRAEPLPLRLYEITRSDGDGRAPIVVGKIRARTGKIAIAEFRVQLGSEGAFDYVGEAALRSLMTGRVYKAIEVPDYAPREVASA